MGTAAAIIPRLAVPTAGFVASAIIPLQAYQIFSPRRTYD
jgi:hypothetical protein